MKTTFYLVFYLVLLPVALCLCASVVPLAFIITLHAQTPLQRAGAALRTTPASAPGRPGGPRNGQEYPYRKAGGRYWNITPLFNAADGTHPALPGWTFFWGEVTQNGRGGIFVKATEYRHLQFERGDRLLFLKNYPRHLPDGTAIKFYALRDGTLDYLTIQGANATVAQYDYGEPFNPAAMPVRTNNPATPTNGWILLTPGAPGGTNSHSFKTP